MKLIIAFTFLVNMMYSQMDILRYRSYDEQYNTETTIRTPNYSLEFNYNLSTKDVVRICIYSDSVNRTTHRVAIFVLFPNYVNMQETSLYITYMNGEKLKYNILKIRSNGIVDFYLDNTNYDPVFKFGILEFEFEGICSFKNNIEPYYFINFYNTLKEQLK